jgi:hypothetical protein
MAFPTPNFDENVLSTDPFFIGNFHKTLPHNAFGEVLPEAYRKFQRVCLEIEAGSPRNFDEVPGGPLTTAEAPAQSAFAVNALPGLVKYTAKFTSPMAGASTEVLGPDPKALEMPPAPGCQAVTAMAEMVELYWMALLRDAPLLALQDQATPPQPGCAGLAAHDAALGYAVAGRVQSATQAVNALFDLAVGDLGDPGHLRAPLDVAAGVGGAQVVRQTLFRSGLRDEQFGPYVSQFFIQPVGYGVQTIDQREVPYVAKRDFLTTHGDWLLAQNTGKDKYGRDYANCNHYADQLHRGAAYYPTSNGQPNGPVPRRAIATLRDLARFVNRDALHQA